MTRRSPIRIGLSMPPWLPVPLHTPARILLGLAFGALLAGFGVALAFTLDGMLRGGASDIGLGVLRLAGLVALALLLRRWARR